MLAELAMRSRQCGARDNGGWARFHHQQRLTTAQVLVIQHVISRGLDDRTIYRDRPKSELGLALISGANIHGHWKRVYEHLITP